MPIDLRKVGLSATSNLVSNTAGAVKERFQATGNVESVGEKYKNVAKAKEGVYQFVDLRYPENIGTEKNKPALMFYIMSNENPELKKENGVSTATGVRNIENEIPTTKEFAEQHQKSIQSNSDKIKENNDKNIPAKEKELEQKESEILDKENLEIEDIKIDLEKLGEEKLNLENALKDYTQNLRIKEAYLDRREIERDIIRSRLESGGYFYSGSPKVEWEQKDEDDYLYLNGAVYNGVFLVKEDTDEGEIGKLKKEIQEFNTKKVTVNEKEISQDKLDEERKIKTDEYFAKEKELIKSKNDLKKLNKEKEEINAEIDSLKNENKELASKNNDLQVNEKQLKEENKKRNDALSEIKNLTKNQTNVLATKRNGNTKLASIISMYVPATVDSNLAAKYSEVDLSSFITAFGQSAINALSAAGKLNLQTKNFDNMIKTATAATIDTFEKTLPGFREGAEIVRGYGVRTDRFELAFKGMQKRKFSFDFKFIPKSEQEAKQAYEIIKTFRYYMSPSITGKGPEGKERLEEIKKIEEAVAKRLGKERRNKLLTGKDKIYFNQPAFFEIKFMMGNVRNQFPIDFGRCVLESCNVKYGGDRTQFHKEMELPDGSKGFPHGEIQMTLNFLELETIYNERVLEGY